MITRRFLLEMAGTSAAFLGASHLLPRGVSPAASESAFKHSPLLPEGTRAEAILDSLPGKRPLIKLSYRPPNYETPLEYFRTAITPNDAFFVRYHLSNIPKVDAKTWKLKVGGEGASGEIQLNLDDLKAMPAVEMVAVKSMFRQSARSLHAACRRRAMGLRCDGVRSLERCNVKGRARQDRGEKRSDRNRVRRSR